MSNLDFQMLKWQREVLNEKPRFKVVVAGRRCGKTRFSVVETIIKALQCPDKTGGVLYVPLLCQWHAHWYGTCCVTLVDQ